jgi:hypothetical protein
MDLKIALARIDADSERLESDDEPAAYRELRNPQSEWRDEARFADEERNSRISSGPAISKRLREQAGYMTAPGPLAAPQAKNRVLARGRPCMRMKGRRLQGWRLQGWRSREHGLGDKGRR